MATLCSECKHVRLNNKSDGPWRWYCIKHPRLAGWSFVTDKMLNMQPFLRCADVNGGACPLYEQGLNQLTHLQDAQDERG